jgi:hypothetical protein
MQLLKGSLVSICAQTESTPLLKGEAKPLLCQKNSGHGLIRGHTPMGFAARTTIPVRNEASH